MKHNTNPYANFDTEIRSPFKSTGFRIATALVILIGLITVVFMVLMLTGNLPFDYSYSYSVNYGDGGYSEQESYNLK